MGGTDDGVNATPRGGGASESEFSRRLDSVTPSHKAKRSKIPAFAGASTPGSSRLGLADRTNLE